jgi:hypothetical protein
MVTPRGVEPDVTAPAAGRTLQLAQPHRLDSDLFRSRSRSVLAAKTVDGIENEMEERRSYCRARARSYSPSSEGGGAPRIVADDCYEPSTLRVRPTGDRRSSTLGRRERKRSLSSRCGCASCRVLPAAGAVTSGSTPHFLTVHWYIADGRGWWGGVGRGKSPRRRDNSLPACKQP